MVQTLQQIFGANAALANGTLSIQLSDLVAYGLDSTKPGAILRSLIKKVKTDFNPQSTAYSDPTVGVVAPSFESANTFTTRGTETQVAVTMSLLFHETYSSVDDPDNTI